MTESELDGLACAVLAHALDHNTDAVDELIGDNPVALALVRQATGVLLWGLSGHLTGVNQYKAPVCEHFLADHMRGWAVEFVRYGMDAQA